MKRLFKTALLAFAGFALGTGSARAQSAVSYAEGDLLLGVRGTSATEEYVVNLGQASNYTGAASAFTVSGLGNIKTDLDAIFGVGWKTDGTVFWSVSGTTGSFNTVGSDPAKTTYATKVQAVVGTPNASNTRWTRQGNTTQGTITSKMNGLVGSYSTDSGSGQPNISTANSTKAVRRSTTVTNSYSSYMPGGTVANSGPAPGISFAQYGPTIEASFANGTANSVLELYRMRPAGGTTGVPVGTAGDYIGTFVLNDNGALTFTPAPPPGQAIVALSSATYSVAENVGNGKLTVTVNRSGETQTAATVNIGTTDGSAVSTTDFGTPSVTTVSFAATETQKTVDIPIVNRAGVQGDRTFTVTISSPGADTQLGTPTSAVATIAEAETGVKVELLTKTVSENAGTVAVKLQRVGASAAFTATVSTTNGTALAGTDYTALTSVGVDFTAGDTEKTVSVTIANLPGAQGDRAFDVTIASATNAVTVLAQATTTVTIQDLLVPGTLAFSAATYQKAENIGSDALLTITVNRTGGTDGAASVEVARTGGTATATDDFTLPASPVLLNWAAGQGGAQTFDITIKSDANVEATPETILLALQNATGATLGTPNTATVSILDGDSTAPTLTVTAPKAKAKFTAANVTFTGNAKDNAGVARVEVALNGGAPQSATTSGATTDFNWTLTLTPEQGVNVAVVTAFDLAGNPSAPITINFTFANLRPLLAGKYNGLLVNATAAELFARNGLVNVTVTKTGTFTGKVTIAGVTLPIGGVFLTGGDARFGKTLTPTFELIKKAKPANISLGFLALKLDTGAGMEITGTLKDGAAATLANISADLAVYTAKKNPVAPFKNVPTALYDATKEKGKYTGAVLPPTVVAANTPAGNGAGVLTISTGGIAKFVGTLADGSKVSYSNVLASDNHWPVFVQLYGKQGFVGGDVAFDPAQTQTDATGALTWFKPAIATDKLYPAGWSTGIASTFIGSKYLAPGALNAGTALGVGVAPAPNTTTANIAILATDGALPADTSNDASLDAKGKVTVIGATAGQTGATALTAKFTSSSGAISGSFIHPGNTKAVKFTGIAFQKTNTAYGYFIYAPVGGTAAAGAVGVVKK